MEEGGQSEESRGDRNVLCLHCIYVKFLVVIFYCSFIRHDHRGKWGEEYMGLLCIISCNCMWIYNYFNKHLIKEKAIVLFINCSPSIYIHIWIAFFYQVNNQVKYFIMLYIFIRASHLNYELIFKSLFGF